MERISFPETVKLLAERYGIPLPKTESTPEADQTAKERLALLEIHERATGIFKSQLTSSSEGKQALAYLKERGLSDQTIEKFGLGYASGFSDNLIRRLSGTFSTELLFKSGLVQTSESAGRTIAFVGGSCSQFAVNQERSSPSVEESSAKDNQSI